MIKLSSKLRQGAAAIAITAGISSSFFALAQPGPGFGSGMMGGGGPGMSMGAGHGRMMASNDADFVKFQRERLGQLKSQLSITQEQQPAWDAFTSAVAEQSKAMQTLRQDMSSSSAPERMARQQQAMGERQKMMATMSESFTRLNEVLTPEQRKVFDRSHGPMRRG